MPMKPEFGRRATARKLVAASAAFLLLASGKQHKSDVGKQTKSSCFPTDKWRTLPPTPALPEPDEDGLVQAVGASLYVARYKPILNMSPDEPLSPVLLLHGGLANSNYWGAVIPELTTNRGLIVMDTRGHGRSTLGSKELSYDLLASDVVAVLDHFRIARASIVGWSDGGIVGLQMGITRPSRVDKLFLFGANFNSSGIIPGGNKNILFRQFEQRCAAECLANSPEADAYGRLRRALSVMWQREPRYRLGELAHITASTVISDGEHDEIIARSHSIALADAIPSAKLVIQPCVSHFALLQDPIGFSREVIAAGI